jgi:2-dehydropantoate 2-reductase
MRIAIVGSGGVGAYFGGRLAAAADVTFIARGAHLAALRQKGLRVESPLGNLHLHRVNATDDAATVGTVDVVFFTVKLYDSEAATGLLPPLVGASTLVVPFQNGVESVEMLGRAVGRAHVAGGTAYVAAVIAEPGLIRHMAMNRLIFGPIEPGQTARLEALVDACRSAGIEAILSDRVIVDIWTKFARLSAIAGMTAITRSPIGPILDDPDLFDLTKAALRESIAVTRGRQIPLPDDLFEETLETLKALPATARSSMLDDLERGRPLELPWLSGAVVRLGREVGVETPTHHFIATALKLHVKGRSRSQGFTNAY